jgi:Cadherin domain
LCLNNFQGINGELYYNIVFGNEEGQFYIEPKTGVIYPNATFVGKKGVQYELTVEVLDEAGEVRRWEEPSMTRY